MNVGQMPHQSDVTSNDKASSQSIMMRIMALGLIPFVGLCTLLFFVYSGFVALEKTSRETHTLSTQQAHYITLQKSLTILKQQAQRIGVDSAVPSQLLATLSQVKTDVSKAKSGLNIHYPELFNQTLTLQKQVGVLQGLWKKQTLLSQQGETLDDRLGWVGKQIKEQKNSILVTMKGLKEQSDKAFAYHKQLVLGKISDAKSAKYNQMFLLVMVALSIMGVFLAVSFIVARRIASPISHILTNMQSINQGQLSGDVEGINRQDEIGDIARLLSEFRQNAQNIHALQTQLKETIARKTQSSKMKENVLAQMSQDIKKPLKSILGFSETIQGDLKVAQQTGKIDFPKMTGQLETLHSTGDGMVSLVESVIDLTSDLDHDQVEPTTFNVREEVQQMLPQVEVDILQYKNKLRVNCPDASLTMTSHSHTIMKCLKCLVKNAAEATKSGMITLEIIKVKWGEYDAIQFSVIDTGVGLDRERLKDLNQTNLQDDFGVYSMGAIKGQSGQTSKTGLGLVLVKKIVKDMFGRLKAEHNASAGTKVTVTFPADHKSAVDRNASIALTSLSDAV